MQKLFIANEKIPGIHFTEDYAYHLRINIINPISHGGGSLGPEPLNHGHPGTNQMLKKCWDFEPKIENVE